MGKRERLFLELSFLISKYRKLGSLRFFFFLLPPVIPFWKTLTSHYPTCRGVLVTSFWLKTIYLVMTLLSCLLILFDDNDMDRFRKKISRFGTSVHFIISSKDQKKFEVKRLEGRKWERFSNVSPRFFLLLLSFPFSKIVI